MARSIFRLESQAARFAAWAGVLVLASAWGSSHAAVYRWVDGHGRTVYSQSPPPSDHAVTIKLTPPPPPDEVRAAEANAQSEIARASEIQAKRERAANKRAMQDATAQQREESEDLCRTARANLEAGQKLWAWPFRGPNGRYVSQEDKAATIREAQEQIATYCR
jgi:hypothetical protein